MSSTHEFKDGYCKFCGSMYPGENNSCVRSGGDQNSSIQPEPKLRIMAVDDIDVIYNRIQELKSENQEMVNHIGE